MFSNCVYETIWDPAPIIQLTVYNYITRDTFKRSKIKMKFPSPLLFWICFIPCNRLLVPHSAPHAHWNSDAKICSLSLCIYILISPCSLHVPAPILRFLLSQGTIPFTNQYIPISYYKAITVIDLWWVLLGKNNSELTVTVKEGLVKTKTNVHKAPESFIWSLQPKAWIALPQF